MISIHRPRYGRWYWPKAYRSPKGDTLFIDIGGLVLRLGNGLL
jgi:hypothetical protein